ncbi:AbrB/MazE/SpoVT family DNA-binding domain-containing protein [Pusillimonas sp. MFBS29]|uniref:AbrB/MazE/SpoVT family DNA-binding domain-containing protein n=1 Tax=Pusillimonas sp. MFBS29 TaxID=2886690 RepID=UPI001D12F681|nr:AbrB/MazE/SpoVT family DNA-binding domain-containing protein [Pusillimonas sp. MFBS29]MCC2595302.1 AbrB/MazE/SpoVT family DNA-binding domain-containing protein [Pusillimonas sp. MFBS29]
MPIFKEKAMRGAIKKWGNSAAIRLPSSMLKSLKLSPDDIVEIRLERNSIVIQPLREQEYLLGQLLSGIKPKNLHPEIDFGAAGE